MNNIAFLIFQIAFMIVGLALVFAFIRLIKGPTSADRVVALDAMTISGISLIVFIALNANRIIYLDVAMVYALISFLGVIAVARYLEGGL